MSRFATPSVLVVEDEREVADLYAEWLSGHYDVGTAYSGETAMEMLNEGSDVVLLDRRMPGLSGDQVLDRIREKGLDCRVVIVSAVEPDFDVIDLGFDDYLVKPVSKDDLVDAVERMEKRLEYDRDLQEFFAIVSKKATLEADKLEHELQGNEEYLALLEKIDERREHVDATLSALDRQDLRAVLQLTGDRKRSDLSLPGQ